MSVSVAVTKYLRTSPHKARVVLDLVRNKDVQTAQAILSNLNKAVAAPILKTLNSAVANAKSQKNIESEELYICKVTADGGPMLKRFKAQAMGRATTIRRRTSHIIIELDKREVVPAKGGSASGGKKAAPSAMQPKKQAQVASGKKTKQAKTV